MVLVSFVTEKKFDVGTRSSEVAASFSIASAKPRDEIDNPS
jgi:hypothetical protein